MASSARLRTLHLPASGRVAALPRVGQATDADLVARALGGDPSAEETIYRRHAEAVAGLALRLIRNRADMEDVVQDTFAIALTKLTTLRERDALRAWLMQIAVRLVRKRLRRAALLRFVGLAPGADSPLDALASSDLDPESYAELAALDHVLCELPTEQRIAWVLRHAEGESIEAVALACECSASTAKRRVAAADAHVQRHVRLREVT